MRRYVSTLAELYRCAGKNPEWEKLSPIVQKTEICEYGALLLLDAMVKTNGRNAVILEQIVDRLENRYFSTGISTCDEIQKEEILGQLDERFPSIDMRTNFLLAVDRLPLAHKVRVVLSGEKEKEKKDFPPPSPSLSSEVSHWREMDPVDMEEWEKTQFLKGEEKVKRMRHVEAPVKQMGKGKRLRSLFALQMLESVPSMSLNDLIVYAVMDCEEKVFPWGFETGCTRSAYSSLT